MKNGSYPKEELADLIHKIREITATDEYAMDFSPGATNEEIALFEQGNNFSFPEPVKEWLRFTDGCCLFNTTIQFYGVAHKPYIETNPEGISGDYIRIGTFNFGEPICISRNSSKIIQYGETLIEYENFINFIKLIIKIGERN
jgi:hypothetical protein